MEGVLSYGLKFSYGELEELYYVTVDPEGLPQTTVLTLDIYPDISPFKPPRHQLLGEMAILAEQVSGLQDRIEIQKLAANMSEVVQDE